MAKQAIEKVKTQVQIDMDAAANEAKLALDRLLAKTPKATAQDLLAFHKTWYLKAGHKRLGQLYVRVS